MTDQPDFFKPVANSHTRNNSLSNAVTLTPPAGASWLFIQALGANVRYTFDGTTPTATVGFQLKKDNPPIRIPATTGMTIRVIQEASGAEIQYAYTG